MLHGHPHGQQRDLRTRRAPLLAAAVRRLAGKEADLASYERTAFTHDGETVETYTHANGLKVSARAQLSSYWS